MRRIKMKQMFFKNGKTALFFLAVCALLSAEAEEGVKEKNYKDLKIGLVDFRACVEDSKLGKQEQAAFEAVKKKMESVLEEKEKELNELADKLNDPDQLDLMSAEAETELKRKFRALSQDLSQLQAQYYQSLNQTNMKIVQSLADTIAEASEMVAEEDHFDLLINNESTFFCKGTLDVSPKVVAKMDWIFDEEAKKISPTKELIE